MSDPLVRYWDRNWNLLDDQRDAENITVDGTFGHANVRTIARVERYLVSTMPPQLTLTEGKPNA